MPQRRLPGSPLAPAIQSPLSARKSRPYQVEGPWRVGCRCAAAGHRLPPTIVETQSRPEWVSIVRLSKETSRAGTPLCCIVMQSSIVLSKESTATKPRLISASLFAGCKELHSFMKGEIQKACTPRLYTLVKIRLSKSWVNMQILKLSASNVLVALALAMGMGPRIASAARLNVTALAKRRSWLRGQDGGRSRLDIAEWSVATS